jgi:hypothetical protein
MKFREVQTTEGFVSCVHHLSNGKFISTITLESRLWPKYQEHKTNGKLANPIISDPAEPYAPTLDELKAQRIAEIDARSVELRNNGFVYNGNTYAMTQEDETAWKDLLLAAESGLVSYPVNVYDAEKTQHQLADLAEVKSFISAFISTREGFLEPGRVLKSSIQSAVTEAGLNVIVDNR